jgi:hypothetical protein
LFHRTQRLILSEIRDLFKHGFAPKREDS